jgi:hypothetical protein
MLRILLCLDNRLADGGEIVNLTRRPRFTPQKHFLVVISVRDSVNPRAMVGLEVLGKSENSIISSGLETATFLHAAQCLLKRTYSYLYHLRAK